MPAAGNLLFEIETDMENRKDKTAIERENIS